jgi:SAM-dependent methyltransferase
MWTAEDAGRVAVLLQIVGEALCEAVDLRESERLLDVVAGDGDASLAAALGMGDVVSGVRMSRRRGIRPRRMEGVFDVALSTFGVMFAPNPRRVAKELLRAVKPGGRIGLATWSPEGFFGELLQVMKRFAPRDAGLASSSEWGIEARLFRHFATDASEIRTTRRTYVFHDLSAERWIDVFCRYYGPIHRLFDSLDVAGRKQLHRALVRLLAKFNRAGRNALVVPAQYLQVVIHRA